MAIAKYIRYNTDGSIKSEEHYPVEVEAGNQVRFTDNSFINDCAANPKDLHPATMVYDGLYGIVLRTDSEQQAVWNIYTKTVVDMPVVVQGDDGSIIYCNPLNFVKL